MVEHIGALPVQLSGRVAFFMSAPREGMPLTAEP